MNLQILKQYSNYEQVVRCEDSHTGLVAIIAIHSTYLGPSLGGCRMYPYKTEEDALKDVLNLSLSMSYKSALADLKLGGGKSVIIGDPYIENSVELFKTFGKFVNSFQGKYIVAKDVGITKKELNYIHDTTSHVLGYSNKKGEIGDPSYYTALGIYYGIKTCVQKKLNKDSLKNIKIAIQGLGAVGSFLLKFLIKEEAEIVVTDINEKIVFKAKNKFPQIKTVSPDEILKTSCDVLSPCALGFVINEHTLEHLDCKIIAGGANNQLSFDDLAYELDKKDILYVPDFVINSGGIIFIYSGIKPFQTEKWVENKIFNISNRIAELYEESQKQKRPLVTIAINEAKRRIYKK